MEGAVPWAAASQPVEVQQVVQIAQLLAAPCCCQSLQVMPTLPTADCLMPKVQPEMSTWQYMAYGA